MICVTAHIDASNVSVKTGQRSWWVRVPFPALRTFIPWQPYPGGTGGPLRAGSGGWQGGGGGDILSR